MTDLDPCATKLAQLIAALTVEADELERFAAQNALLGAANESAFNDYGAALAWATHHAQTQHAKRLREIIEEAGK